MKKSTRGKGILDVFLTNCSHLWKPPIVIKGLVRSDHLTVMVSPRDAAKPDRKVINFRDVREHRKLEMSRKLEACDWNGICSCEDVDKAVQSLNDTITVLINQCFPAKISSRNPPFMPPLVKHLCIIRNTNLKKYGLIENTDLHDRINSLVRKNQVCAVRSENNKHGAGTKG